MHDRFALSRFMHFAPHWLALAALAMREDCLSVACIGVDGNISLTLSRPQSHIRDWDSLPVKLLSHSFPVRCECHA
jgi:hypothetical protein